MTQPSIPAAPAPRLEPALATNTALDLVPESFWAVLLRRSRYVVAVLLSAILFCTLGWKVAAPPPEWAGVSLMAWPNHGLFAAFNLTLMLLVATGICSLLVHPDSPHMGLFCALLGMAGLSIRGGTVFMLIEHAQVHGDYARTSQVLAIECLQWAIILVIGEFFTRILHDWFLSNTHWITRSAPDISSEHLQHSLPGRAAMGVSKDVSTWMRTHNMRRLVATPLAMLYSGLVGFLLLYVLMQSQQKGQVLVACFVAFYGSTILAYLTFPRVPILALLLVAPLTAAVAYLWGMKTPPTIPGHAAYFAMRALPIDYFTAGVPGAILGYYGGFRWSLHSPVES